ncbi:MAG: TIGR00270 family protein [Candidatus Diapherotrites archaeon]|nr:TIGR00270 family protein [Candidatus Diapherotrites archaeon]
MQCEICGSSGNCVKIRFEGNNVFACQNCSSLGPRIENKPVYTSAEPGASARVESVLVKDFGERIKHARESKNLTLEEVAKKLFEKESFLQKIEHGHVPSDDLAKKIESFFGITLFEIVSIEKQVLKKQDDKMTLWDLAKK